MTRCSAGSTATRESSVALPPRLCLDRRVRSLAIALLVAGGCGTPAKPQVLKKPAIEPQVPSGPPARVEIGQPARTGGAKPDRLLELLTAELTRSLAELGKQGQAPYFTAYEAGDYRATSIAASFGAIERSTETHQRYVDVDVRAGDYKFDNTHRMRGGRARGLTLSATLPLEDDPYAIATTLWLTTDSAAKQAAEQLTKTLAAKKVTVGEEDQSDDFSREAPTEYFEPPASITIDRSEWETRLRKLSAKFREHPEILVSNLSLLGSAETQYYVNSEGTRYQIPFVSVRITISASTRADDGMMLSRTESFDLRGTEHLPTDAQIAAKIERVVDDLASLRKAPVAEPYSGPAILEGQAAAVFFHEVFGHRIEGHRQKDESEGQTFSKKVGQRIAPTFIDVYDDPSAATLNGVDLAGFYQFDDEGVPGQRASLIEQGVLKTFLMARMPIRGVVQSNGHGRRSRGRSVVARQGNLIVAPRSTVARTTLQAMLLDDVKKQHKPYGLVIRELDGGFTMTERFSPQAFKLMPVMAYRLYPDGREELIRGADLEGTPLAALADIRAAGDDVATFNGSCGAESGYVAVSASSPSLLIGRVELTKKQKSSERAPALPPPPFVPEDAR
jgi:TldD protein